MPDEQPPYDFDAAYKAWSRVPVDDFTYLDGNDLIGLHLGQLVELMEIGWFFRWNENQWRNFGGGLVDFLQADRWRGKTVMDFGCGFGLDAVRFAAAGADVVLADLHPKILFIAQQVVGAATRRDTKRSVVVGPTFPYFTCGMELFWSFGVLHHLPHAGDVLKSACEQLNPGGEVRFCVYSDRRWRRMMSEPPPAGPAWRHPRWSEWVRKCDSVGDYADFYDEERLRKLVEPFGELSECRYLCKDEMIGAVVKPKGGK